MRRRLLLAGGIILTVAIHTAGAADLPIPYKAPPVPAPVFNWTGFYVGGNFGGGWGSQTINGTDTGIDSNGPSAGLPLISSVSDTTRLSGVFGGGQVGYNYELPNNWLLGIEADVDASGIRGSSTACLPVISDASGGFTPGTIGGCGSISSKLEDFGTVRGRVGYIWNNVMLYGTGGWAWGHAAATTTPICGASPTAPCPGAGAGPIIGDILSFSNTFGGWAAGGGAEWQFLPHWTLRLEYLHLQFNGIGMNATAAGTFIMPGCCTINSTESISARSNMGVDTVRVGMNYMFNWSPPPLAR